MSNGPNFAKSELYHSDFTMRPTSSGNIGAGARGRGSTDLVGGPAIST